jgi:hypothetical protein
MRLSLSFVLLALIPVAPTFAATSYTVFTTADSGAQSLRAVIEAINANSTETVFNLNFNVGSNQTILVNSNLPRIGRANSFITIDGSLSPGLSIDGQGTSSLFYANQNALLVVRDLTLTRGESSEGGCLRAGTDGPPMTVQRVLFSGCIAGIGSGGAISASAQLNVTDSVFVDNRMNGMSGVGSGGGAILKTGTGNLIVEGSSFIGQRGAGRWQHQFDRVVRWCHLHRRRQPQSRHSWQLVQRQSRRQPGRVDRWFRWRNPCGRWRADGRTQFLPWQSSRS